MRLAASTHSWALRRFFLLAYRVHEMCLLEVRQLPGTYHLCVPGDVSFFRPRRLVLSSTFPRLARGVSRFDLIYLVACVVSQASPCMPTLRLIVP